MSSSINDLKQQIQNLKEKKQRIQQSIRHIWDDIGGLQSDTKEQHRLFPTQEDFREAIQVREHHVERLEFTLLQIENTIRELEERIEMGKEDKKGAGFSRERETTNGNLRLTGGIEVSDDEMSVDSQGSEESEESNPDEYPFQYNDVLGALEVLDDLHDDDERRAIWDEMGLDAMMTDSNTHLQQEPHLILTPDQEFWVTEVQQLYQFWRNHLFPPLQPPAVPHVEGGRMSGGKLFNLLSLNGQIDTKILFKPWKKKAIKELSAFVNEIKAKMGEIDVELNYFYSHWDRRNENPEISNRINKLSPLIQPLEDFRNNLVNLIPEVQAFHKQKVLDNAGAKIFNGEELRAKVNRLGFAEDIHEQIANWKKVYKQCKLNDFGVYTEVKELAQNQIAEYEAFANLIGI